MLRVGVVGIGSMGNVHVNHYKRISETEISAFDIDHEALAKFADRQEISASESLDQLISWADVVDICLPTPLHAATGLRAIAAGRAVLMEKPMALDVPECLALLEAADKARVPLMPAQVVRYFAEFEYAHQSSTSGELGKIATVRMRRGGKAPNREWFLDFQKSGGVLLDVAVHEFDWLNWTLGRVSSVFSSSLMGRARGGDYALTLLKFESGALGHVESTWLDPSGFRTSFEVCGSAGMLEFDSRQGSALRSYLGTGSFYETPQAPDDDPYFRQLKDFVDAIRTGSELPIKAVDGLAAVAIARAAIQSAVTGLAVAPDY